MKKIIMAIVVAGAFFTACNKEKTTELETLKNEITMNEEGKITQYVEIFNPIVAARGFGLLDQIK